MRCLARAIGLATAAVILAHPASAATLGELDAWCAPEQSGGRPSLCSGYLGTILEGLASKDPTMNGGTRACVPAEEDRSRVIQIMHDYAQKNPVALKQSAVVALGPALKAHYPCE